MIAGMVEELATRHRVDRQRVFVAGLSAGGAMAAILGRAYPELFAAVGVHSGLPVGAARDLASAMAAQAIPGNPGIDHEANPQIRGIEWRQGLGTFFCEELVGDLGGRKVPQALWPPSASAATTALRVNG